jgi:ribosome-binding factor A
MNSSNLREVKREKKKSLFFRELSQLVQMISESEPKVAKVYVTRVDFADDLSVCYAYLSTYAEFSEEIFDDALRVLKLYKPSVRKELATRINPRYTPDIIFVYDKAKEKQSRIDTLLDKVRDDFGSDK